MTDGTTALKTDEKSSAKRSFNENDLATLRHLLLGPEYQSVLKTTQKVSDPALLAELITPAISEALKHKTQNNNLKAILTPTVVDALMDSTTSDPKPIADALYPVMGPAIRKSISSTMSQMTDNFNQLLEQSVSPKAWRWRFDAWRTGQNYADVVLLKNLVYQVEQIFLIHRETGLLLQHVVAGTAISKDPDMISAMLTAIQDFTSDSFSVEQNSSLNSLKLGDLTLLIENGPYAVLAFVVRGTVPNNMQSSLSEIIERIHLEENRKLVTYKGDSSLFDHLKPILEEHLQTQLITKQKKKKAKITNNRFFKPILCFLALTLISGYIYSHYVTGQEQEEWAVIKSVFQSKPGIVTTSAVHENGKFIISGLVDPLAEKPSLLIKRGTLKHIKVDLDFRPYLSMEPEIVLKRLQEAFNIPDSVKPSLNNNILILTGRSTQAWLDKFRSEAVKFSGVKSLDTTKLLIVN